jgi:phospholipid/cholesterol/gamma-HCH transport system substrate-binding protein
VKFERWGETILGAIVVVVAVGFFAFAAAQAGQTSGRAGYELSALFNRVDGISVGSDVRVSGVKVGVVKAIGLDTDSYQARLTFTIDNNVKVNDQSSARIQSDGLLGGAYVSIEPAGLTALKPGQMIENTQGTVDLLSLFASFAGGGANHANTTTTSTQGSSTP